MPIYEYELCEGECAVCGGRFTLCRPLSAAPLTKCPACKKPVRKVFSTFNSPKALSISDAKKAGFRPAFFLDFEQRLLARLHLRPQPRDLFLQLLVWR